MDADELSVDADDWPRGVGGHLVTPDVRGDPALSPIEFRCVRCGLVLDPSDVEAFETTPCETTRQKDRDAGEVPGGPGLQQ